MILWFFKSSDQNTELCRPGRLWPSCSPCWFTPHHIAPALTSLLRYQLRHACVVFRVWFIWICPWNIPFSDKLHYVLCLLYTFYIWPTFMVMTCKYTQFPAGGGTDKYASFKYNLPFIIGPAHVANYMFSVALNVDAEAGPLCKTVTICHCWANIGPPRKWEALDTVETQICLLMAQQTTRASPIVIEHWQSQFRATILPPASPM